MPLGPVQQHVGEKPIGQLDVRIGRFAGDGRASFVADLGDRTTTLTYTAADGGHRLEADDPTVALTAGPDIVLAST